MRTFSRRLLFVLAVSVLLLSSCKRLEVSLENANQNEEVISRLEVLGEGKIDGFDVKLGDKIDNIISKFGDPVEENYFMGSKYISYKNFNVFLDDYIFGISFFSGNTIFGIEIGKSTPSMVKDLLGEPNDEYQDHENEFDESSTNDYVLVYQVGKYTLEFYSDSADVAVKAAYVHESRPK